MAGFSTLPFYTKIKNVSGEKKKYSFLPPHGVELDINSDFKFEGDLFAALTRGRGRSAGKRAVDAFIDAIQRGDLAIIESNRLFLFDRTQQNTKQLDLVAGSLTANDPDYLESESV